MLRYEDYEQDSNTANSHLKTITAGASYAFKGLTKIKANYLIRNPDSSNIITAQEADAVGSSIGNLFIIQMIVLFGS